MVGIVSAEEIVWLNLVDWQRALYWLAVKATARGDSELAQDLRQVAGMSKAFHGERCSPLPMPPGWKP